MNTVESKLAFGTLLLVAIDLGAILVWNCIAEVIGILGVIGIIFAIACVLTCSIAIFSNGIKPKPDGSLIVNQQDPTKDIFRFELDITPGEMVSKKQIIFEVKNK